MCVWKNTRKCAGETRWTCSGPQCKPGSKSNVPHSRARRTYLLRVLVQDMAHYSRFVMDTLLRHPGVQDCKASFVLDKVKNTTAVPL